MAKVTAISFENFRVFKDTKVITLSPFTILTGTNNSGKSSVLKALLLLSSNANENNLNKLDFNLHGEKHNLGRYNNVLNDSSKDLSFTIKIEGNDVWESEIMEQLEYTDPKTGKKEVDLVPSDVFDRYRELVLNVKFSNNGEYGVIKSITALDTSDKKSKKIKRVFTLKSDNDNTSIYNLYWFYRDAKRSGIRFHRYSERNQNLPVLNSLSSYPDKFGSDIFKDKLKSFDQDLVNEFIEDFNMRLFFILPHYFKFISSENIIVKYNTDLTKKNLSRLTKVKDLFTIEDNKKYDDFVLYVGNISISEIVKEVELHTIFENTIKYAENLSNHFIKFFNFNYLEAQKSNSQRYYSRKWQGSALNELLVQYRKLLNEGKKEDGRTEFLDYWMGKNGFNLGQELKFIWEDKGIEIKLTKNGRVTDLSDLGYGTNQMLALLLKIITIPLHPDRYKHPGKKTLMLEEPEINLHPNLQSRLADMFVDAYQRFDIHFIIETHSEYLIRKLQYLTAKKEISPEDSSIYYFTHPEDLKEAEEQVKELKIREDGMMDEDFGPGFFDEATRLTMNLLKIQNRN